MIRLCEAHELLTIHAIINDAAVAYKNIIPDDRYHEPYMELEELEQEMQDGVQFWGCTGTDGELLGVMGLQHKGDVSLIRHAYVRSVSRNQGVGGELLQHLIAHTDKPILIGTWAAAGWAIGFYEKHGFRLVSLEEKERLLRLYWNVPERQIEESVVLQTGEAHVQASLQQAQAARIERIRAQEKAYHDECYEQHVLFEPGSWLHKPVQTVMDILPELIQSDSMRVLDLGSGVGRNTIPIAAFLKPLSGKVVAVDLLSSAIDGLIGYSRQHGVEQQIEAVQSDIEGYSIEPHSFDAIIAVSTLEHVSSEIILKRKLKEMANGTKEGGINCIIIGTNTQETIIATNEPLDPMFEINMRTDVMLELLHDNYEGWETMRSLVKPLTFDINRGAELVRLTSDCVTYVIRKPIS